MSFSLAAAVGLLGKAFSTYAARKFLKSLLRKFAVCVCLSSGVFLVLPGLADQSADSNTGKQGDVTVVQTPGALAPSVEIKCISASEIKSIYSPTDIYPAVLDCVRKSRYEDATTLFAYAGLVGRFDMTRVIDRSAHSAIPQLQLVFLTSKLSTDEKSTFLAVSKKLFSDQSFLQDFCAQTAKMGPPQYQPTYMISHGMGAVIEGLGGASTEEPSASFDANSAWLQVRSTYLHCEKL